MPQTLWTSLLALLIALAGHAQAANGLNRSVVKIFTVSKPADWAQPWQMAQQYNSSGSGFILEGQRIMTNAHVVGDQVNLQVRKAGDTNKYSARVEFVGHDTELAILKVDDPAFFEGTEAVKLGGLPHQRDKVAVYGFPMGGDEMSITEGVVSRLEVRLYTHSQRHLLTIQVDAAINPGNSGGPVFKDGRLVGVSFQAYQGAQGQGFIIPVPVIERFLADIRDGHYDGLPLLGMAWQKLENPSFRAWRGLAKDQGGVQVTYVTPGSSAWGVVKAGDVLLELEGQPIANNGTVAFRDDERVLYHHLVALRQLGTRVKLKVMRDRKVLDLELTLKPPIDLVARPQYDIAPSYFIFAGFVFEPLTYNYMASRDTPSRFRYYFEEGMVSEDRSQVVFFTQVLPHDINQGYHDMGNRVVERVNGRPVRDMRELIAAFQAPQGGYHVVELDRVAELPGTCTELVVLDAAKAAAANPEILKRFGIAADRSEDLKDAKNP